MSFTALRMCARHAYSDANTHTVQRAAFHEWNNRYTTIQWLSSGSMGECRLSTGGTLCNGRRSQWPGKFAEDEMALPGLPGSYFSLPFSSHLSLSEAFARAVEIESGARSRKRPSGSLLFCGWTFLRGFSRGQCWNTVRILNCTR